MTRTGSAHRRPARRGRILSSRASTTSTVPCSTTSPTIAGAPSPTARGRRPALAALARLRHFVDDVLPMFGPHEDAMVERSWHLAHSVLSPYLNVGLLLPGEVCDAVQDALRRGPGADRLGRGLHPPGDRMARVRVGRLLAVDARLPRPQRAWRRPAGAAGVPWRGDHRHELRAQLHVDTARPRLQPPHPAADGARQPRDAARRRPVGDDRVDVVELRRRRRVGDAPERDRDEPVGRRRDDGHQAIRGRRQLHRQDERLLQRMSLRPQAARRATMRARSRRSTGTSWRATTTCW